MQIASLCIQNFPAVLPVKMSSKKKTDDFKQEDILQAVVIADSFNVRFAPLTENKPRALLPLANVPLLDYTLEFLSAAGIQKAIVFCCAHADLIKDHLESSKWNLSNGSADTQESIASQLTVTTVTSDSCLSAGDALRDLDAKGMLKTDFVLVSGDVVAHLDLRALIDEHKQRRLKEKTPIMTLLYKEVPPVYTKRSQEEDVILAINRPNNRILHYQNVGLAKKYRFPLDMFTQNRDVEIRYDLMNTHVTLCSPQVPLFFTENFDYATIEDLIRGVLENEEILGNTILVKVLKEEYAARISNLQMYDSVSKDVISRWTYPYVPDFNISNEDEDRYSYKRHNVYLHKDVTLARGCVLHENVVIGIGAAIGSNTHISDSVIGKNCSIGQNVKIEGAYIWDGVRIEDNCNITTAILDYDVHVKKNVTISPGCVLGEVVVVGPNVTIPPQTKLVAKPSVPKDDDSFEENDKDVPDGSNAILDQNIVGAEGKGYVYQPQYDSDDEEAEDELVQDMWGLSIQSDEEAESSDESESSDEDFDIETHIQDDSKIFYEEVVGTMERAIEENVGLGNMVLEVNSLKHAYNIQIKEVNALVVKAVIMYPLRSQSDMEPTEYLTQFKVLFKKMIVLFRNYIKSDESQLDCLNSLEECSILNPTISTVLVKIVHILYSQDILSEEAVLKWYKTQPVGEDKAKKQQIRKQMSAFVKWLEEAEEESDSD